jgi:hypothetical protein
VLQVDHLCEVLLLHLQLLSRLFGVDHGLELFLDLVELRPVVFAFLEIFALLLKDHYHVFDSNLFLADQIAFPGWFPCYNCGLHFSSAFLITFYYRMTLWLPFGEW